MNRYTLFILLLFCCTFISASEPFYYRDDNDSLRINNIYSRDEHGNLIIDNDVAIMQLSTDSTLSSLEMLDLIDSLNPSINKLIEKSNTLSKVATKDKQEMRLYKYEVKYLLIALLFVVAYIIHREKNKKKQ